MLNIIPVRYAFCLLVMSALTGCGQMGPLTLPDQKGQHEHHQAQKILALGSMEHDSP